MPGEEGKGGNGEGDKGTAGDSAKLQDQIKQLQSDLQSVKQAKEQIEKQFGLLRKGPIGKLDGWLAPLLWNEYKRGKTEALNALVRYNAEDTVNLRTLMEKSFTLSLRKIPFQVQFAETLKSVMKLPDYDRSYLRDFLRRYSS